MHMRAHHILLSSLCLLVNAEHHVSKSFLGVDQASDPVVTADDHWCGEFYNLACFFLLLWCICNCCCEDGGGGGRACGMFCLWGATFALTLGTIYMAWHGVFGAYWAGTLDPKKHAYCAALLPMALAMWCCTCVCVCCCVPVVGAAGAVVKMEEDRKRKEALMMQHAAMYEALAKMNEQRQKMKEEFESKCRKAFTDADKDGNGKLDIEELRHVALFHLNEKEKAVVEQNDLFQQAFQANDKNKDNMIDPQEFVTLMHWIQTHVHFVEAKTSGHIPEDA